MKKKSTKRRGQSFLKKMLAEMHGLSANLRESQDTLSRAATTWRRGARTKRYTVATKRLLDVFERITDTRMAVEKAVEEIHKLQR